MDITYCKYGDYHIPNLKLSDTVYAPLGKYGRLRETHLKEYHSARYSHLLLSEQLYPHLMEIDKQARHLLDTMIPQLKAQQGVTEALKSTNQMEWVGRMANIKAQVEELIFSQIVYI